jgi:hypothetical protein
MKQPSVWDKANERRRLKSELDRIIVSGGKSIKGIEPHQNVLIVDWKSSDACWSHGFRIDWLIREDLPTARERFRVIIHRAKGEIERDAVA